jgi:hypothetical protein
VASWIAQQGMHKIFTFLRNFQSFDICITQKMCVHRLRKLQKSSEDTTQHTVDFHITQRSGTNKSKLLTVAVPLSPPMLCSLPLTVGKKIMEHIPQL